MKKVRGLDDEKLGNVEGLGASGMQIDFHHAVTYVVAGLAGFGHRGTERRREEETAVSVD